MKTGHLYFAIFRTFLLWVDKWVGKSFGLNVGINLKNLF